LWLRAANGDAVVSKNACHNSLNRSARFSPLRQRQRRSLSLRTEVGEITLLVDYGQDGQSGRWYCPVQEQWGLRPHQKLTPGLVEKLGFTATATGSYQKATEVAAKWGQAVEDSTVRAHVQVAGARAEAHRQQRGDNPPLVGPVPQALVIMMDGWLVCATGAGRAGGGVARAGLLRASPPPAPVSETCQRRLSGRQRGDGIILCPVARPLQTLRPVLAAARA
jgi:hypothetical protein